MELTNALRMLNHPDIFDEHRTNFIRDSSEKVKRGFEKVGAPTDLLANVENLLFGTEARPGIWAELPARIAAIQKAYKVVQDKLGSTAFTKMIEVMQSRRADILASYLAPQTQEISIDSSGKIIDNSPNVKIAESSPLEAYEETLELLQQQWAQVTTLLSLNKPMLKHVQGVDPKDLGDENLQYVIDRLQEVIESHHLSDCIDAVSKISNLDDDYERQRSVLENDYETRRLDNRNQFLQYGNNSFANNHGKILRDKWMRNENCSDLTGPGLECFDPLVFLGGLYMRIHLVAGAMLTALHDVKMATVTEYDAIFPEIDTTEAPTIKAIESHWFPQDRGNMVKVFRLLLRQASIAKALPESYRNEDAIADLYPTCRDFGIRLDRTIEHAKLLRTALCELQCVLAVELNPKCESLLNATADLYGSMQLGDTDDMDHNLQDWLNKSVAVNYAFSRLQSLVGPNYPPPPREARTGSQSMAGRETSAGPSTGLDVNHILWGISRFDIAPHKIFRLAANFEGGTTPTISTWSDTQIVSARMSWIEIPQDPFIQHGYNSTETRDMYHQTGPGDKFWDFPITFSPRYNGTPNVVCWLTVLDADNGTNLRIDSHAIDVNSEGCTIRIKTWADSKLYKVGFGWLAHPQDHPAVYAATHAFHKRGIFGGGPNRVENNAGKIIHLPGAMQRQRAPPTVAAFVKGFDNDRDKYHRLDTSADKITKQKMTARATSWSDTNMYYAGGTYIAVAME